MPPSSILFLNRVVPPDWGATGWRLGDLAERFAQAGWRVTVVACGAGGEHAWPASVRVRRAGGRAADGLLGYAGAWMRLVLAALGQPRHDVVVTMTDPPLLALAGPLLARVRGSALIHWSHDVYPDLLPVLGKPLPAPLQAVLGRAMRAAMRRHDAVVAIGPCMAARLAAQGLDPHRLSVIPNWADAAIRPDPPGASAWRREAGLEDRFVVVYAGNFGLAHPIETIMQAAALLAGPAPRIHFLLVGQGRRRAAIEALVRHRSLPNLSLLPRQVPERMPALLGAADLHLAAMANEAVGLLVPNKVAAAFAAGRPCVFIGPENSSPADAIRQAGAGATIRPGDGRGLAEAVLAFAQDGARWRSACEAAQGLSGMNAAEAGRRFMDLAKRVCAGRRADRMAPGKGGT